MSFPPTRGLDHRPEIPMHEMPEELGFSTKEFVCKGEKAQDIHSNNMFQALLQTGGCLEGNPLFDSAVDRDTDSQKYIKIQPVLSPGGPKAYWAIFTLQMNCASYGTRLMFVIDPTSDDNTIPSEAINYLLGPTKNTRNHSKLQRSGNGQEVLECFVAYNSVRLRVKDSKRWGKVSVLGNTFFWSNIHSKIKKSHVCVFAPLVERSAPQHSGPIAANPFTHHTPPSATGLYQIQSGQAYPPQTSNSVRTDYRPNIHGRPREEDLSASRYNHDTNAVPRSPQTNGYSSQANGSFLNPARPIFHGARSEHGQNQQFNTNLNTCPGPNHYSVHEHTTVPSPAYQLFSMPGSYNALVQQQVPRQQDRVNYTHMFPAVPPPARRDAVSQMRGATLVPPPEPRNAVSPHPEMEVGQQFQFAAPSTSVSTHRPEHIRSGVDQLAPNLAQSLDDSLETTGGPDFDAGYGAMHHNSDGSILSSVNFDLANWLLRQQHLAEGEVGEDQVREEA